MSVIAGNCIQSLMVGFFFFFLLFFFFFLFKSFYSHIRNVFSVGLWGRRTDTADTLCQRRETLGEFLGFWVCFLGCPCCPAPSETHWKETEGEDTLEAELYSVTAPLPTSLPREANGPSASRGRRDAAGSLSPAHPAQRCSWRRYQQRHHQL